MSIGDPDYELLRRAGAADRRTHASSREQKKRCNSATAFHISSHILQLVQLRCCVLQALWRESAIIAIAPHAGMAFLNRS